MAYDGIHHTLTAKLFERCETRKLSLRVYGARWRMLGHMLGHAPAY